MNNLYLILYFFAYHLATSGVPPVVRVPPVENRWPIIYVHTDTSIHTYIQLHMVRILDSKIEIALIYSPNRLLEHPSRRLKTKRSSLIKVLGLLYLWFYCFHKNANERAQDLCCNTVAVCNYPQLLKA